MGTKSTVDELNALLRDELMAIETYQQALTGRSAFSGKTELSICQLSHEKRAEILREQIELLGGKPAETSGARGVVAKIVEGGAVAMGEGVAIRVLEEWEDRGLRDYVARSESLDPPVREVVTMKLLPEQVQTYRVIFDLKKRLSRPD
jgi:Domain of unknown function (DUF2383)